MQRLFRRVLVVVAHPDDETGGCGILLQRAADPMVVFATDGAPDDHWFWPNCESRTAYAELRRAEALAALATAGVNNIRFIADAQPACRDQHLHDVLAPALGAVSAAVAEYRPDALLAPAYEGGHPDHDACSFLAALIGERFSLPVWEMPLYHRLPSGELVVQRFLAPIGEEHVLRPTQDELRRKWRMLECYRSQPGLSRFVPSRVERFRPQPAYDYLRPPHCGMLNYEAWQWPMRGSEVSRAFAACLQQLKTTSGERLTA